MGNWVRWPFSNPAIPVFSVLEAWLSSHDSHISSPGLEAVLLQVQVQHLSPLFVVPLGYQEEGRFLFFCFADSKIQKITRSIRLGKNSFLKVKSRNELAQKPGRVKGTIPNEKMYLQNTSLSPRYRRNCIEFVGHNFLEKEIIPICSPHKGIVWILFDPCFSNLGYEFS